MDDQEFLKWIHSRLVSVHGENARAYVVGAEVDDA